MIVIVCLDNNNGMTFNNRRQSQDSAVIERIHEKFAGQKIHVETYSAELFPDKSLIYVNDNFLENAGKNKVCFIERENLLPYEDKIEMIIVYRWNREYPSDTKFDIPLGDDVWRLVKTMDFVGHSHKKITEETYKK